MRVGPTFSPKAAQMVPKCSQKLSQMAPKAAREGAMHSSSWFAWFWCRSLVELLFSWFQNGKNDATFVQNLKKQRTSAHNAFQCRIFDCKSDLFWKNAPKVDPGPWGTNRVSNHFSSLSRFGVFWEMCKRYNTSSNFRALEDEKTHAFFLHCFLCFCKLANGPIHPPIWPPLLHPFFIKTLLLGPPAITGLPGAPKSTQGCPRVPPGTLFYWFWLPFGSAWVPPGPFPDRFFVDLGPFCMQCPASSFGLGDPMHASISIFKRLEVARWRVLAEGIGYR